MMKKFLLIVCLVCAAVSAGWLGTAPDLYTIKGLSNLSAATLTALSSGQHVAIADALSVTENATFPENVFIHFTPGGSVTIPATCTLALSGTVIAPPRQIFSGSGAISFYRCNNTEISANWWGAGAAGSTDDSDEIQKAIDAVKRSRTGTSPHQWSTKIKFEAQVYTIGSTLDMGGFYGGHLSGAGGAISNTRTYFTGATGAGTPVIDATAAHFGILENIYIGMTTSTVGVLVGYAGSDAIGFKMIRMHIDAPNDMTANGGLGTVGVFNSCAEHSEYHDCFIYANLPVVLTTGLTTSWIPGSTAASWVASSSFRTMSGPSCGIHNFVGNNVLFARSCTRPCVAMLNTNCVSFGTTYFGRESQTGTYPAAIYSHNSVTVTGLGTHFEAIGTLFDIYNAYGWDFDSFVSDSTASATTNRIFNFVSGGKLVGSRFSVYNQQYNKRWFPATTTMTVINSEFSAANNDHAYRPLNSTYEGNFTGCTFRRYNETTTTNGAGDMTTFGGKTFGVATSGSIANQPIVYVTYVPSTFATGASFLTLDAILFADAAGEKAAMRILASDVISADSAGTYYPTVTYLYAGVASYAQSTDASVVAFETSYVYVATSTYGWTAYLTTTVSGTASDVASISIKWTGSLTNTGYGSEKPYFDFGDGY